MPLILALTFRFYIKLFKISFFQYFFFIFLKYKYVLAHFQKNIYIYLILNIILYKLGSLDLKKKRKKVMENGRFGVECAAVQEGKCIWFFFFFFFFFLENLFFLYWLWWWMIKKFCRSLQNKGHYHLLGILICMKNDIVDTYSINFFFG